MSGASDLSVAFAKVIRRYRARRGFSQEVLAEMAGIHHTYVGLVERGKRKPTIEVAERLARALGKKLSTLIGEAERECQKMSAGLAVLTQNPKTRRAIS